MYFQVFKRNNTLLLKVNLVVSLLLLSITIVLSKWIIKQINRLIQSTQRIAGGYFSKRVKVVSDDEIGSLSKNFNDMAAVVEDKITQLEKNSADKQRFIDNLAHEMRTPLTSIIGYADYLRTTRYDEEIFINSLSYIYEEGKRLEKLAINLMDLIVLRKEDFSMKQENANELLTEMKSSFVPKLEGKGIRLEIEAENISIFMDKDLLKILLTNLIDNAIKASKTGDVIFVRACKNAASNVILQIQDQGVGISQEDLPKVFEPFFVADKSRAKAGVGLGLSLCSEIAKIHHAEIEIKSKLGEGTMVEFTFPKE